MDYKKVLSWGPQLLTSINLNYYIKAALVHKKQAYLPQYENSNVQDIDPAMDHVKSRWAVLGGIRAEGSP